MFIYKTLAFADTLKKTILYTQILPNINQIRQWDFNP